MVTVTTDHHSDSPSVWMLDLGACRSNRYTMTAPLRTSTAAATRKRPRCPRRNTDRTNRKLKITRTGGKTTETSMTGWVSA